MYYRFETKLLESSAWGTPAALQFPKHYQGLLCSPLSILAVSCRPASQLIGMSLPVSNIDCSAGSWNKDIKYWTYCISMPPFLCRARCLLDFATLRICTDNKLVYEFMTIYEKKNRSSNVPQNTSLFDYYCMQS